MNPNEHYDPHADPGPIAPNESAEDDAVERNAPPIDGMAVDLAAGGVASDGDQPNPIEQTRGGSARVA